MKLRILMIEAEGNTGTIGSLLAGALGGEPVLPAFTIEEPPPCPEPVAFPKRSTRGKDWKQRERRRRPAPQPRT